MYFRRSLASSSIDGVCAVINHACSVLEQKFIELLKGRLRLGYPSGALSQAYNLVQSSLQQGKLQSSDVERARQQFLVSAVTYVYLNLKQFLRLVFLHIGVGKECCQYTYQVWVEELSNAIGRGNVESGVLIAIAVFTAKCTMQFLLLPHKFSLLYLYTVSC